MDFQKSILDRFFGRSKQDASEKAPNMREQVDAAEPPPDPESFHEPLIVSPTLANEFMLDVLDRSAEDVANIINDLALNDVSNSLPKPTVPGKRKRQDTDAVNGSLKKRVTKRNGIKETRDDPATTSTIGVTTHRGGSSSASSEVVRAAPGKLPRPKEQQKRHMAQNYPAVQSSDNFWNPPSSPHKQSEKGPPPPTTPKRNPPRPRGRPRRVGPSPIEKTTTIDKGQRPNTQQMKGKPGHEVRPEGYVSPELESREGYEISVKSLRQKGGPKAQQKASRTKTTTGENHRKQVSDRRSTRSIASANGQKDAILNANTDLTKKPELDARRAAKQRKSLEQVSETTPPTAMLDSMAQKRNRKVARRTQITKNCIRARAQRASLKVQNHVVGEEREEEGEESEREEIPDPEGAVDRDGQISNHMDEREGEGTEAEEEESDSEGPTQVVGSNDEADGQEEMELFGADGAWKTVLEGAQSVCGTKPPLNHMLKLLTKTIRDLVHDVREARRSYKQLWPSRAGDHDSRDGINAQLSKSLNAIEDRIGRLSAETAATEASEVIRDIYARAIPAMVFLLQSALESRIYHSIEPCDLETLNSIVIGLEEIIRLQEMAILLCETARKWEAKPVLTSQPIVKPTSQKILPNLRHMRDAFSKQLHEQKKKRKAKENALKTAQKQESLLQSSQQASREAARKNDIFNRKLKEALDKDDEERRNVTPSYKEWVENGRQA